MKEQKRKRKKEAADVRYADEKRVQDCLIPLWPGQITVTSQ